MMNEKPSATTISSEMQEIHALLREMIDLRDTMIAEAERAADRLEGITPAYRDSAENLLHYLALRRRDIRPLQMRLAALGLSSLGRAEPCVLATVDAVIHALERLAEDHTEPPRSFHRLDFQAGQRLLIEHTESLLGSQPPQRSVRIMVTVPTEAATDYGLVHQMLDKGMNGMRINCAHDSSAVWEGMIANLRRAEETLGKRCKIIMDLGGPKLRTGPVEAGPAVIHIRPERDAFGKMVAPARIWLTAEDNSHQAPTACDATLPVSSVWLAALQPKDRICLIDARGKPRRWTVIEAADGGCWVESDQSCYVTPGTELALADGPPNQATAKVGPLPPRPGALILQKGDLLTLTAAPTPGRPATRDVLGRLLTPAIISCTIPQVLPSLKAGEPIWFDDGKIGGIVEAVETDRVLVQITHARPGGEKLRADKGINLPESHLRLDALTAEDIENLPFVAAHADVVEMSFVNSARDVTLLEERLRSLGERQPAIVLKVETRRGFENLPAMLLAAMRWPCCGVMIARGDLAVECGFERLAEIQEEILWICEAAHIPVIWATQVLENLAQKGMPSRAEITDAAMGHRAECVMLNKGPHVVEAVELLDDILRRMQAHQIKKRAMLRELRLAHVPAE